MNFEMYNINQKIRILEDECVDPETGVFDETHFESGMKALKLEKEQLIEHLALMYKEQQHFLQSIKNERNALLERQTNLEIRSESLKNTISKYLDGKFETGRVKINFRKSNRIRITDTADLESLPSRVKKEPDKTKIKELLKSGVKINGVYLDEINNIIIK